MNNLQLVHFLGSLDMPTKIPKQKKFSIFFHIKFLFCRKSILYSVLLHHQHIISNIIFILHSVTNELCRLLKILIHIFLHKMAKRKIE